MESTLQSLIEIILAKVWVGSIMTSATTSGTELLC
jgi:hypothetical protein